MGLTKVFLVFYVCVFAAFCGGGALRADAAGLELTFSNQTDRTVSVAIYRDLIMHTVQGWYNVEPGKNRTIVIKTAPGEPPGQVGYYAKAAKEGEKTVYWSGDMVKAWVHPTKAFNYEGNYDGTDLNYEKGSPNTQVGFRGINIEGYDEDQEEDSEKPMQGKVTFKLK